MHNSKPQLSKNGFKIKYKTIIDKKICGNFKFYYRNNAVINSKNHYKFDNVYSYYSHFLGKENHSANFQINRMGKC